MERLTPTRSPKDFDRSPSRANPLLDGVALPDRPTGRESLQVITTGAWESAAAHCQLRRYASIAVVSDSVIDLHFGAYLGKCLGNEFTRIDGPLAKKKGEVTLDSYRLKNVDVIIAVGGGTNIDQAKMFSKYSGIPWIALPTKPTAAILSGHASVMINGRRVSEATPIAEAVFVDRALFGKLDPLCAKAEYGDSLSSLTAVGDAYVSNIDRGTPLRGAILREAYRVASDSLAIDDIRSSKGIMNLYRANLRYAEVMNDYQSSLPCSGSEHAISHALDTLGSTQLHGIQVGFTTLVGTHLQSPFTDLAQRFETEGLVRVSTEELRENLKKHGFPTKLSELGISRETFEGALNKAPTVRSDDDRRYTVLDRYNVSEAISNLARVGIV